MQVLVKFRRLQAYLYYNTKSINEFQQDWQGNSSNLPKTLMKTKNNHNLPFIIAQGGPLDGQRWVLKSQLIIGRDSSCDIPIPDRQVSRKHAMISCTEEGVLLEDLSSKNGTFCNSHKIEPSCLLSEGDEIQVALSQIFFFLSSDATLPLEDLPFGINTERCLKLDSASHQVWILGKELEPALSFAQFCLLQQLYLKSGEVVSRPEMISAVWGSETEFITEQALDALIRRLRDRLIQLDPDHEYLVTVRGHGLRLDNPLIVD